MKTVAIIQARTGSTRLPGKVMYPLAGKPAVQHVIDRVNRAERVDETVLATSTKSPNDVLTRYAPTFGADVVRGSESNVLDRFYQAAEQYGPDIVVRVTADCPLVSPQFVDFCIQTATTAAVDYASAGLERTFPRGVTCEAFTYESFREVVADSSEPRHEEHVTPYYRENPDQFALENIRSNALFDEEWLRDRTDIRLTLDEPDDYCLLEKVYREVDYDDILPLRDVIQYIDTNGLAEINEHIVQKTLS